MSRIKAFSSRPLRSGSSQKRGVAACIHPPQGILSESTWKQKLPRPFGGAGTIWLTHFAVTQRDRRLHLLVKSANQPPFSSCAAGYAEALRQVWCGPVTTRKRRRYLLNCLANLLNLLNVHGSAAQLAGVVADGCLGHVQQLSYSALLHRISIRQLSCNGRSHGRNERPNSNLTRESQTLRPSEFLPEEN